MTNRLQNFIAGELQDPSAKKWFAHESGLEIPDSNLLDVAKAVQAANKSLPDWQKKTLEDRAQILVEIASLIDSHIEDAALAECEDIGTPVQHSRLRFRKAAEIFRIWSHAVLMDSQTSVVRNDTVFCSMRHPVGLAAIFVPWSDPWVALANRVAPALALGNAVIAKGSELTPRLNDLFAKLLSRAGLPPGVFSLLQGRGDDVGRALAAHPGISHIAFMGRTETGREIWRESAEFLKRVHLSLSARNPILVFAESELEKTAQQVAKISMNYHGPTCLRGSKLFVQESIYDKFLELFRTECEKLVVGDPRDAKTFLGTLPSESAALKLSQVLTQAVKEKGKVLFGEPNPESLRQAPRPVAVFDLTMCSTLQQEEVIGPFVSIASFKYQHDSLKHANTGPLNLAGYVFHSDAKKALRIATKLEAGRVFINAGGPIEEERMSVQNPESTGLGYEGVEAWMRFFSRETLISQSFGQST